MTGILRVALISLVIPLAVACSTMIPMYNLDDQPVGRELKVEEVQKAIKLGAGSAGWRTQDVSPGVMLATYNIRAHTVVAEIRYDKDSYSINYNHSDKMKMQCSEQDPDNKNIVVSASGREDCPGGTPPVRIHKNYREWIDRLNLAIAASLSSA